MNECSFCWEDSNHELEIHDKSKKFPRVKSVYFCDFHETIMGMITVNDAFFDEVK